MLAVPFAMSAAAVVFAVDFSSTSPSSSRAMG